MRSASPLLRPLLAVGLVLGIAAWVQATHSPTRGTAAEPGAVLVPFVLESARQLGPVDAQVLVANVGPEGSPLRARRLRVVSEGTTLVDLPLDLDLPGDPRYREANRRIERLPHGHGHGERWFADPDAPEFAGQEVARAWTEVDALLDGLRADLAAGQPAPFAHVDFRLALDRVFAADDPPGTVRELELRVDVEGPGGPAALTVTHPVERLSPPLAVPPSLGSLGFDIHAGDLHVHSCHGEAVGACAPSTDCAAESLQTSGSFTYAQLKSQYQALGMDWFTATDHSYCINSDAEYATIVGECAALTDASFLVVPDIELSSDEEGAQVGSDLGDLLCILGGTAANHMGAHGIDSRKEGGSDGLLGFCNPLFGDALDPFSQNIAKVRAEGGYTIANHPAADSFAWNSFDAAVGIEADGLHGVEIWNGALQTGQGGNVARWVDWLLAGRILYAYSGSDTHDAAFAFGANHVLLDGQSFTIDNLEAALKAGRVFLSNEHQLVLEVDQGGATLPMGTLQALAPGAAADPLTLRVHYNFGADTATVTFFTGRVGDATETVACTSPPLTGSGVFECPATLDPSGRTWFRAYSESPGKAAYTNPVFFLPGSCDYGTYGAGLGGANVAALSSASSPSAGSWNTLDVSGFGPAAGPAFYALSPAQIPAGVPFLGGFLLVGAPFAFTGTGGLVGGAGSFSFPIPSDVVSGGTLYWQAAALDPGQPAGFGFSSGLVMTLCGLLR